KEPRAAYLFARRTDVGSGSTFVAVCEANAGDSTIEKVRSLISDPLTDENSAVAIEITLKSGRRDYIVHQSPAAATPLTVASAKSNVAAAFAKWSLDEKGGLIDATLLGGTSLELPNLKLALPQSHFTGRITRIDYDRSTLSTDADLPPAHG